MMSKDIFSTLRVYLSKLSEGEHSAAEVVASVNAWLRESGESIKIKIEEEVEHSVAKMGFVKQAEFDELKKEVEALRATPPVKKKSPLKKATVKKSAPKAIKKVASTRGKK